jgi:arylsulfatase A-like enzyme
LALAPWLSPADGSAHNRGTVPLSRAFRAFLRPLPTPSLVGAAYVAGLTLWGVRTTTADERQLGAQARQIEALVHGRFHGEIDRVAAAIFAAAIVVGAGLGLAAAGLLALRRKLHGASPRRRARNPIAVLALVALLHGALELWGMSHDPQLYAAAWYAQGGWRRTVQVLATDVLHPTGVAFVTLLACALFLAGPPSRWSRWPDGVARRARRLMGHARRIAAVAVAGTAALLLAVALGRLPLARARAAQDDARPNVLVLAADSLRDDRLDPRTAPHLSALAEKGTRFDGAYVSLPRTFPSWVTLLTGRHPHHHGIRSMFPRWEERTRGFDALPERLARAGWVTGVVSDYAGDIFSRIDLGFRTVDVPEFDFRQLVRQRALERAVPLLPALHSRVGRAAFPVLREMNDAADPQMLASDAIRTMRALEARGPFCLVVFFSTAHFPYAAPSPYYRLFADPGYRGRFKYSKPVGLGAEAPPDAHDERQVRALYDGAVLAVDDAAQDILDALDRDGIAKRTIVVVTADHGETLYDHGHGIGHGDHLFGDEGTHVPLVVFDPRRGAARREAAIVRDVDLAPTLYALTGVAPQPALDGLPLKPALAYAETDLWFTEEIPGLAPDLRMPYPGIARLTEVDTQHGDELVLQKAVHALTLVAKHRMVRDDRYKLVYVPTRSGVHWLLFDTLVDPGEERDVAASHPDVVARLQGELWAWMQRDPEMTERHGYLVPRDEGGHGAASVDIGLVRLGDDGAGTPPAQGAP